MQSSLDNNNSQRQISSKISSLNSTNESLKNWKESRKKQASSVTESLNKTSSQLNKLATKQKRFQRNFTTNTDTLYNFIGLTRGTGSNTGKFLRRLLLKAAIKSEPEIKNIIAQGAIKAIGCSEEQTYVGVDQSRLTNLGLDLLPNNEAIFVPVQSLDLITLASGMLKQQLTSPLGQILYEQSGATLQNLGSFKNYGGKEAFPMNNQLNVAIENPNRSYQKLLNTFYQGTSAQVLLDFQYQTTNEFGVTGDFYKVALLQRSGSTISTLPSTAATPNQVTQFIQDYYSTIKLFDTTNLAAQIINFLSKCFAMQEPFGANQISQQSKFFLIAQRILGLCFDSRTEIDVSGNAKVAELDGIDDSFFEFTEVDLRNIDLETSNIQQGVVEFQDCDNVKLPINFQNLTQQLINLRNQQNLTVDQQVDAVDNIIESISENPDWKIYLNTGLNVKSAIDKDFIKNLALAVASTALSPKALFPIFIMLNVVEKNAINTYNQQASSANTFGTSATTINSQINNIVLDSVNFLKIFKKFSIDVISKIGAIFVRNLFELLKKDLLNLIRNVIEDIKSEQLRKKYKRKLRLAEIAIQLASELIKAFDDYRKCKSLLDNIKTILNLINGSIVKRGKLNLVSLILSDFLPGESADRAFINTTEYLQSVGIPTGALPSGAPNLMLLYNLATHRGRSDEQAENGVNDVICAPSGSPCWSVPV